MGIRVSFMTVFGALLVGISGCSSVMLPLGVAHLRTQLGTLVLAQGVFQPRPEGTRSRDQTPCEYSWVEVPKASDI